MTGQLSRLEDPLPDEVEERLDEWRRLNSSLEIVCWSWEDFRDLVSVDEEGRRVLAAVQSCRLIAMKSDIMRLEILRRLGGVWSDMKNKPQFDFISELPLKQDGFLVEHWPFPKKQDTRNFFSNSLFGCAPQNGFISESLQFSLERVEEKASGETIPFLTGGGVFTRLFKRDPAGVAAVVKADVCWGGWIVRKAMSYNAGSKHWSVRQKTEPLYW
ncbi:glycosyltransferase [Phaeobacter sp. CAU 1743]|uniref:glycosyltransferase family 32 protein n=1 Tax=Phaeobacter sp. CAU 1743 TaxID=3140367 RepID=UPI00325AFB3E